MITPPLTTRRMAAAVHAARARFDVPAPALVGRRRSAPVVRARAVTILALTEACATTVVQLGERFHRHHTTILWIVQQARGRAVDPTYRTDVDAIIAAIHQVDAPALPAHACADHRKGTS
jgi:chromosomal replication initiation ATPase DnaA